MTAERHILDGPTPAPGPARTLGRELAGPAVLLAALAGLAAVSAWQYLVFHSLVELFSVAVSVAVLLIAWNVRSRLSNDFLLFVALALAASAMLDLMHTLTYKGMGAMSDATSNEPTQLWIAARSLQAVCLLIAPIWLTRRLPLAPAVAALLLYDAAILLTVLRPWSWVPAFPTCYSEEQGLTTFKVVGEYVICAVLLAAIAALWARRRLLDRAVFLCVALALAVTMASEITFTKYVGVYGPANVIGHLLKVVAVYLTYRALIVVGLQRPYDLLFRELAESERRARMLAAATFEGIVISREGRCVDCNEQLAALLGYAREDLIGRDIADFIHPDDREAVMANVRRGRESRAEFRMPRRDGTWVFVEVHGQTVGEGDSRLRYTAVRDVSHRRQAEEALRRSSQELARSNKELQQFAHTVSHDLQEPLRAVTGFLQLLEKRLGSAIDEKGREYIRFALGGARHMARLIEDLLEYSRVQTRAREPVPTDLNRVFEEARASCAAGIRESGALVTADPLPTVPGDPTQLRQLLQNLLGNAVKFRRSGVRPVVHVSARPDGTFWTFQVRDNGIGIPAGQEEAVFEIFRRLHAPEEYPGTGVGLAICRRIVERHGGRIWLESRLGEGTSVYFTLPGAS